MTSSPSFYKNNMFNAINKQKPICVIYTGAAYHERNADFYKGDLNFDNITLPRDLKGQIKAIRKFFKENEYDEIVFGGWDTKIAWVANMLSQKSKNACIFESTINESPSSGIKGVLKKFFLSRLHKAYPSGLLHSELLRSLGFDGDIVEYGGCGILNYQPQPEYQPREEVKNFIFVGRLIGVKNLEMLISVFNQMPELNLTIVGFGPLESKLKEMARHNVKFTGAIDNAQLPEYYRHADAFILPSKSETWGLVVEEALNNGTPVIVSDRVGCNKDLVSKETGIVFTYNDEDSLKSAIEKMTDIDYYNRLREGVSRMNFNERAQRQINAFL